MSTPNHTNPTLSMSCGAFGGAGTCGGGGGGGLGGGGGTLGPPGGFSMARRCADRGFFDPFCMPVEKPKCEPSCYFNPFVHAQCLGVDMNMQGFRNDILKCQEDYKKAVWAVLKKYAVGEGAKNSSNINSNNASFFQVGLGFNNGNFNQLAGRTNTNNNRRSNSSGFQNDDPRSQRTRRSMYNGRQF